MLTASTPLITPNPRALVWTGRVLTGVTAAFLLFDGLAKVAAIAPVIEATRNLGYGVEVVRPLGVVLVLSTLLHLLPRTQIIGAALLTAYLGGATATQVRVGSPFYWLPVALGVVVWAALCLRDPRLRALVLAPSAA